MTGPYPQILVRPDKAGVLASRHPWVLDRSIIDPSIPPQPGSVVDLVLPDGRWLGRGKYNPASRIRVRMYQWQRDAALDQAWLCGQLDRAAKLRSTWLRHAGSLNSWRLINSEGDGLSGLVIDRFADWFVVQVNAAAVVDWLPAIVEWLRDRYQPRGILQRVDTKTASSEKVTLGDEVLFGDAPTEPIVLEEHGVKIAVDLNEGQKTGYYLDQRQNRLKAAQWSHGRMLDVCTYVGGFALAAAKHGQTTSIMAVDASARALDEAKKNALLNGVDSIEFVQGDCFETLDKLVDGGERFNCVVLDPPKMAGSREQLPSALRAYHRLNSQAMKLLEPGGVLVTCSCSGRVSRADFLEMLAPAARRAEKSLQILEQLGADVDHPWDAACPETEYLKCCIGRVN